MALMNMTEYGRHVGISRQRVSVLIQTGQISAAAITKKGKWTLIDPDMADDDLRRNLDPSKSVAVIPESEMRETIQAAGLGDQDPDYARSRALNEHYKAALKKLEYDAKSGDLIPRSEVEKDAFECARTTRDAMLNIPNRLAAVLSAESDQKKVETILRVEIRNALTALAESL
ncbi:hypothetical protein DSCW_31970 [Desulfosarcina widdelii]|uniref:Terminase small subunit n=1 Tax=Desulfosarcina widdelii TaxID=947919 RepID=A0A5K7Z501_9BACT|nr:hypothetical protein [Desulfosarcina widdelii]BBO75780.1 hypothetical protein DSCW_31970 [Desulfosarcina widdelii]